jgi:hypothetical protein
VCGICKFCSVNKWISFGVLQGIEGSQEGFPLSPFYVPLGRRRAQQTDNQRKENGFFRGIQAMESIEVTHLLFVDDILLFGRGNLREQSYLKTI